MFPNELTTARGQYRPRNPLFKPSNLAKVLDIPALPAITDLQYKTLVDTNTEISHKSTTG